MPPRPTPTATTGGATLQGPPKPPSLCKLWPNCSYGDSCNFFHPQIGPAPPPTPTAEHPWGTAVMIQSHASYHPYVAPYTAVAAGYAPSAPPCRYGDGCKRPGCVFTHPADEAAAAAAAEEAAEAEAAAEFARLEKERERREMTPEQELYYTSILVTKITELPMWTRCPPPPASSPELSPDDTTATAAEGYEEPIYAADGSVFTPLASDLTAILPGIRTLKQVSHWAQEDMLAFLGFPPMPQLLRGIVAASNASAPASPPRSAQGSPFSRCGVTAIAAKSGPKARVWLLTPPNAVSKYRQAALRGYSGVPPPGSSSASAGAAAGSAGGDTRGARRIREGPYILKTVPFVKWGIGNIDESSAASSEGSGGTSAVASTSQRTGPFIAYIGEITPPASDVSLVSPLNEPLSKFSSDAERNKHLLFAQAFTPVPAWHFDPIRLPSRPIGDDNRGKRLLRGLGWRGDGTGLGRAGSGSVEPVEIIVRPERGGLAPPSRPQT